MLLWTMLTYAQLAAHPHPQRSTSVGGAHVAQPLEIRPDIVTKPGPRIDQIAGKWYPPDQVICEAEGDCRQRPLTSQNQHR
jgi:hypothetical protein